MKTNVSDLVKLFEEIEKKKLSITDAINLINNKEKNIQKKPVLIEEEELTEEEEFNLKVDYNKNLTEMIKVGKYDDMDEDDFNQKNFGIPSIFSGKEITLKVKTIGFKGKISKEEVEKEISKKNLLLAGLSELLAFGEQYPELQIHQKIIVLNSDISKFNDFENKVKYYSPNLGFNEKGRTLSLISFKYFDEKDKILCIKK